MNIAIGTTNITKIQAVEETIKDYPLFAKAIIHSFKSPSGVSNQPLSLNEMVQGAKNRASHAYAACEDCRYSFGIESGLFEVSGVQTGFLEATICCVYDGKVHHVGLSMGVEVPPQILDLVLKDKKDLGQASFESGITKNPQLGQAEGLIGVLTNGRINRKEYTKTCIISALIQLEHLNWY